MNSKKLGISHPWYSRCINSSVTEDLWIREFIEGIFVTYGYLLSTLFVQVYGEKINIKLLIFIRRRNPDWLYCLVYLPRLVSLIKSVITLKSNKNVTISFKVVGSVFEDEKILSTLLKRKISKNAFRFRLTLKRVFDTFKQKGNKRNWEKVMSRYGVRRRRRGRGFVWGRVRGVGIVNSIVRV